MGEPTGDLRARIVRLGADLFAARGYHGTGLADLLQAVGVARGGFYHHFPSKESVLLEIVSAAIGRILGTSAQIVAQDRDAATKLRLLCDDLSCAIIDNQPGFIVFLREYSALSETAKEQVLALRRTYLERWEQVLHEGAAAGSFTTRQTPYTEGILGMWIYSFAWNRATVEPQTIASDLADFVLRGVRSDVLQGPLEAAAQPAAPRVDLSRRGADAGVTAPRTTEGDVP